MSLHSIKTDMHSIESYLRRLWNQADRLKGQPAKRLLGIQMNNNSLEKMQSIIDRIGKEFGTNYEWNTFQDLYLEFYTTLKIKLATHGTIDHDICDMISRMRSKILYLEPIKPDDDDDSESSSKTPPEEVVTRENEGTFKVDNVEITLVAADQICGMSEDYDNELQVDDICDEAVHSMLELVIANADMTECFSKLNDAILSPDDRSMKLHLIFRDVCTESASTNTEIDFLATQSKKFLIFKWFYRFK